LDNFGSWKKRKKGEGEKYSLGEKKIPKTESKKPEGVLVGREAELLGNFFEGTKGVLGWNSRKPLERRLEGLGGAARNM